MRVYSRSQGKFLEIPDASSIPGVSPTVAPQGKSVGGFLGNVGRDIGENVQGLLNLPGLLANLVTGKADFGETGKTIGKGVFDEYKNLIQNPVETGYNKPVSSLLDILPFFAAAKGLTATKFASKAGKASTLAQTASKTGVLEGVGSSLRKAVTKPKVPASPYGASVERELSSTADKAGLTGSAASKYGQLPGKMDDLTTQIKAKLTIDKKPLQITKVKKSLESSLDDSLNYDPTIKPYVAAKDKLINQLLKKASGSKVSKLSLYEAKQNLGKQLKRAYDKVEKGNPLSPAEEVGVTLYGKLKSLIDGGNKEISKLTELQEKLFKLSSGLKESSNKSFNIPFSNIPIPGSAAPLQAGGDLLGRLLQNTGKLGTGEMTMDKLFTSVTGAAKAGADVRKVPGQLSALAGRQFNQPPTPTGLEGEQIGQEGTDQEGMQLAQDLQESLDAPSQGSVTKEQLVAVLLSPDISEKTKNNIEKIYELDIGSADEKKKATQRSNAERVIDQLEKLYFSAQGSSAGRIGGVSSFLQRKAGGNPLLQRYVQLMQTVRPLLARTLGEVGNLAEGEQRAVVGALPNEFSTYEEAVGGFNDMRLALGINSN